MTRLHENGLTLVELLVAITIMGIIAVAAMPLLSTCLEAHSQGTARSQLYQEGLLAMERMTGGVRRCTYLLIPNAHNITRDILALSGWANPFNEYYFGDPLFPRIDTDFTSDMSQDSESGIDGIDDDGNGQVDEGCADSWRDDDEDLLIDEDPVDGIDNDGDGNVDEDPTADVNGDDKPGIIGMDDDGDGQVDEGDKNDDDEDGDLNDSGLCPVIYSFNSGTNTLSETSTCDSTTTVLSTHITQFQVTYEVPDLTHGPRIQMALTLTGDDGESVQFVEYAYPRNVLQKTGKRVR
jgi:prepilin-type N-terminal cleavage/methylation domain-containing protein